MSGAVDLDGSNRIVNSIVDMGCYEKQAGANPFSCSFNSPVVQGITNVPAVFTATIAGANTNVVYYWWNFGDSTTDSGTNKPVESKTYTTPGYYTVSLAVSNTTGEYAVRTNTGYIYVAPKIAYVSTNGSSSTVPYDTWQKAASNLQSAINIALVFGGDSTLVLVTNGTYVCTNQIEVNKDITVQSVNGPAVTTVTRTNGQMTFWWVHSSGANVSGFTMTNGYCQTAVPGMLLAGGTVSNCVFNGNSGDRSSTLSMSAGTLSNCVIMNGTDLGSYQGCGGVTMTGGKIYNTVIMGNRGGSDSTAIGGLSISGGEVWNCIIASNVYGNGASGWNGGVNMTGGTLRNCLVAANTGNGITQSGGSCENVTVVRNSKVGITNSAGAVTNTIIWFNQSNDVAGVAANFHFCNASNLVNDPSGTGNLNGNPCFFSPGSGYGTNATLGNYRLLNYSPCVNHAVILPWMINATDLAGGRRVTGNTSDIGAYESIAAGTIIMLN